MGHKICNPTEPENFRKSHHASFLHLVNTEVAIFHIQHTTARLKDGVVISFSRPSVLLDNNDLSALGVVRGGV